MAAEELDTDEAFWRSEEVVSGVHTAPLASGPLPVFEREPLYEPATCCAVGQLFLFRLRSFDGDPNVRLRVVQPDGDYQSWPRVICCPFCGRSYT